MESGYVIFITSGVYGTRLLGDERGSIRWDSTHILPCPPLRAYMRRNLNDPIVEFSPDEQSIVHDAIIDRATRSGWTVDALNVRSTHFHIVLFVPNGVSPTEVGRRLKESATRALYKAGSRKQGTSVWTKMFSRTTIWNITFWRRAVTYVLEKQGENDYLYQTEFWKNQIKIDQETPSEQEFDIYELYGGEERAKIRAEFFLRMAREKRDREQEEFIEKYGRTNGQPRLSEARMELSKGAARNNGQPRLSEARMELSKGAARNNGQPRLSEARMELPKSNENTRRRAN